MNEIEKGIQEAYDSKPFVGHFKLLAGLHNEGGRTYQRGEIIHSKSHLLRLNPLNPNLMPKFEEVEAPPEEAKAKTA